MIDESTVRSGDTFVWEYDPSTHETVMFVRWAPESKYNTTMGRIWIGFTLEATSKSYYLHTAVEKVGLAYGRFWRQVE